MNKESFWVFGSLGLGDHIVCCALYRHYANLHKDKIVILPIWNHNLAAIQWMLSDVPNIFYYPIETEQQLLMCKDSILEEDKLCLGFYESKYWDVPIRGSNPPTRYKQLKTTKFNPVKWDSEFYRQAGLDPELKWSGFKLPVSCVIPEETLLACRSTGFIRPLNVYHEDKDRGFRILSQNLPKNPLFISKDKDLLSSCVLLYHADEIHCIDSSMLNLADLMETPYCKRFVFHRYARKGLQPLLKKNWEVLD